MAESAFHEGARGGREREQRTNSPAPMARVRVWAMAGDTTMRRAGDAMRRNIMVIVVCSSGVRTRGEEAEFKLRESFVEGRREGARTGGGRVENDGGVCV